MHAHESNAHFLNATHKTADSERISITLEKLIWRDINGSIRRADCSQCGNYPIMDIWATLHALIRSCYETTADQQIPGRDSLDRHDKASLPVKAETKFVFVDIRMRCTSHERYLSKENKHVKAVCLTSMLMFTWVLSKTFVTLRGTYQSIHRSSFLVGGGMVSYLFARVKTRS